MMGLVASPPSDIRAVLNESTQPFIAQGQVVLSSRGKKLPACVASCRLKRGERAGWRAVRGEIEVGERVEVKGLRRAVEGERRVERLERRGEECRELTLFLVDSVDRVNGLWHARR